jgi:hypothetical protein
MIEREKLEREIHQLTQIIGSDAYALASRSTPSADRAGLQKQIEIRTAVRDGLLKLHEAKLTKGALPSTRTAMLAHIKEIKQKHAKAKSKIGVRGP